MNRNISIALRALLICAWSNASYGLVYSEAASGDLTSYPTTAFSLAVGSNTFSGQVGGDTWYKDFDSIAFNVPNQTSLNNISANFTFSGGGTLSSVGLALVPGMNPAIASSLAPKTYDTLYKSESPTTKTIFADSTPLSSGLYNLSFSSLSYPSMWGPTTGILDYSLAFNVQSLAPPPLTIPPNPAPTLPVSTPSISFFPAPDPFFNQNVLTFAQSTQSKFDSTTSQNINLLVTDIKPLIDPQSGVTRWLKATASVAAPDIEKSALLLNTVTNVYDFLEGAALESIAGALSLWADSSATGKFIEADPNLRQIYAASQASYNAAGCIRALTPSPAQLTDAYFCLVSATSTLMSDALVPALEKYASDPPSLNYKNIFQASPVLLPALPSTGNVTVDQYIVDTLNNISLAVAYLDAANQSFDRYAGAYQAGDATYATLQLEAYLGYLNLYDQALRKADTSLKAFASLVDLSRLAAFQYDPTLLAAVQQQIAINSFDIELQNYLLSLGFTPNDLSTLTAEFVAFDPYSIAGSALDGVNLLMDSLALASSLPDPAFVPEPSSVVLVVTMLLLLAAMRCGRQRTNIRRPLA